ncbi:MAG: CHC2 zinc finger domain-containing protein, partial [Nitrospira sp.]|nr:CHC2 zinc finger domain-containing protein [Nitrospira sp.]
MSNPAKINFTQIREDNDLALTVERYLGHSNRGKWLCPFHKEKTPSFCLKADKFKCFGCGVGGDVVDFIALMEKLSIKEAAQRLGNAYILDLGLTPAQIKEKQAEIKAEREGRRLAQLAEEKARQDKALERISQMTGKVEYYHSQVGQALDYWASEGILPHTIKFYKLGYCPNFPLWKEGSIAEYVPSYVIPYFHYGELVSIRHRLAGREGGKYRPEFPGLPARLYNVDCLDELEFSALEPGEVILCEGEKKALVLGQQAIQAVGLPGVALWKKHEEDWIPLFKDTSTVYVILDPNAEQQAKEIALTLNGKGIKAKYVVLPCKVDDYFVLRGGTTPEF